MIKIFFVMLVLLTGCVKDYDFNPYTTVLKQLLNDKKIGLTDLEGFVSVLTSCEIARYTPLSSVDMENDFEKAAQVIIKLDKQLK